MADTYVNTAMASSHITSLMRRINALEVVAAASAGVWTYNRKWGTFGSGNGQLNQPRDVFVYGSEVYIAELSNNRVQVFSTTGTYSRKWTITAPTGVWVDSAEVYLNDSSLDDIVVYNTSGVLQRSWSGTTSPLHVCVSGGEVYVSDVDADVVDVFNTSGTLQRTIGSSGSGNGQLNGPEGIFVYNGELYVCDAANDRISVFNTAGTYQRKWGTTGSGSGQFNNPIGISVTSDVVYVLDSSNSNVQSFSTAGVYQSSFGSAGSGDGELSNARGICIANNEIYISDSGNSRVQVFTPNLTQTTFYSYTSTAATSLGTPDGGVIIPALAALTPANNNADLVPRHIVDMRDAIETLAPYFTNPATSNPYNWTASSADNLFFVANGNRTEYGATGGAAYDWTRTEAQMEGDYAYSIDIGELANTITQLEAS